MKRPLALIAAVSVSILVLGLPLLAVAEPPSGKDSSSASSPPPPTASPQKGDQQAQPSQPKTSAAPQPQPEPSAPPASPAPHPAAVAAGASSVTIHDFAFGPQSLTIHVGDRVTWFNQGPSGHSATANNGSFNTGVLSKGSSGSFRFTTPGTFSYHCTPHPFMKASVTVLAASGSGGSGGGSSGGSNGASASASSASGKGGAASASNQGGGGTSGGLPKTGLDVAGVAGLGLLLLAGGLLVRRRISDAPGA